MLVFVVSASVLLLAALLNVLMRCAIELRAGFAGAGDRDAPGETVLPPDALLPAPEPPPDVGLCICPLAVCCVKIALAVPTREPINALASSLRCCRISSATVVERTGLSCAGCSGCGELLVFSGFGGEVPFVCENSMFIHVEFIKCIPQNKNVILNCYTHMHSGFRFANVCLIPTNQLDLRAALNHTNNGCPA